jgi:hypothetical protein
MDHKRYCRSAEEKTGEWRHHLRNRTKSPIGGEQGGGVTEAARRLRRIGNAATVLTARSDACPNSANP